MSRAGVKAGITLASDPSATLNGKHFHEPKERKRFLSDEEMGWFFRALAQETQFAASSSYRRGYLLMLLTGARIKEVLLAPSSELSADIWSIPGERTKNGEDHFVPLGPWAVALMAGHERGWIIPHPTQDRPIDSEIWYEVRDRIHARMETFAKRPIEAWSPHDLRRTLRSNTNDLDIDGETAKRMMNHVRSGMDRRYDHSTLLRKSGEGFRRWEAHLVQIAREAGVAALIGIPVDAHITTEDVSQSTPERLAA